MLFRLDINVEIKVLPADVGWEQNSKVREEEV